MNLKERLERTAAWVLMTYVAGAFILGLGIGISATTGIIKILQEDLSKKQAAESYIEGNKKSDTKIEMDRSSILENLDRKYGQQTANVNKSIKNSDLFKFGNPIPIGFEQIKVGMRLSVLQSIFPNGKYTGLNDFLIDIKSNKLIRSINCSVNYDDENMNDGTITELMFFFKDSAAHEYVIKQALSVFGSENAISKLRSKVLEWKNVGGFHVKIDQNFYNVENAK